MVYADSHVEFIHHPDDLVGLNTTFLESQISADMIDRVKPAVLFLAIYVEPTAGSWKKILWVCQRYLEEIQRRAWRLVLGKADLKKPGIKVVLHLEDASGIGRELDRFDRLYELGIRSVGLTHNHANQFAGGSLDEEMPLTPFGKEAVQRLVGLGMLLDFAHLSTRSFQDVFSDFPLSPFVSHAGLRGVHDVPRNLPDSILRLIGQRGGYLGLGMAGSFLAAAKATREDYLNQVHYSCDLIGKERVGIGSDLGGVISFLTPGLAGIADIESLADLLPDPAISGGNLLSFLENNLS